MAAEDATGRHGFVNVTTVSGVAWFEQLESFFYW